MTSAPRADDRGVSFELDGEDGRVLVQARETSTSGSGRSSRSAAAWPSPSRGWPGRCGGTGSRWCSRPSGSSRPASAGAAWRAGSTRSARAPRRAWSAACPSARRRSRAASCSARTTASTPPRARTSGAPGLAHLLAVSGPERAPALPARLAAPGAARAHPAGAAAGPARADRALRPGHRRRPVDPAGGRDGGRRVWSRRSPSGPASRWYALLLAAVVTLALNPRAAGDVGWQLSFAAVAGILLWTGRLARCSAAGARPGARPRRAVAEGVAVTVAATVATAPADGPPLRLALAGGAARPTCSRCRRWRRRCGWGC